MKKDNHIRNLITIPFTKTLLLFVFRNSNSMVINKNHQYFMRHFQSDGMRIQSN